MHRCRIALLVLLMAATISQVSYTATDRMAIQKMNQMPLAFTKNMGQWDERVLYRANAGGATMWFTKEGVTYQFTRNIRRGTLHVPAGTRSVPLQKTTLSAPPLAADLDSPLEGLLKNPVYADIEVILWRRWWKVKVIDSNGTIVIKICPRVTIAAQIAPTGPFCRHKSVINLLKLITAATSRH